MAKISVKNSKNSVVFSGNIYSSNVSVGSKGNIDNKVFLEVEKVIDRLGSSKAKNILKSELDKMAASSTQEEYNSSYKNFVSSAADHITLFTPFLASLATAFK